MNQFWFLHNYQKKKKKKKKRYAIKLFWLISSWSTQYHVFQNQIILISTISTILFINFLMVEQIFLLSQLKRIVIINKKTLNRRLALQVTKRIKTWYLTKLKNIRKTSNLYRTVAYYLFPLIKWKFCQY